MKSKSQEELTKKMKRQKVVKRPDLGSGDLQQQVKKWLEIHNDKVQAKLLDEKMKRLAEKLKKPGGEEKLRTRIEKYLSTPEESHNDGDDNFVFKKQLSNEIIRKLKKIYLKPEDTNFNVYRMESSKYSSRSKMQYFKKAVMNWTNALHIKKKDFLGRNVKKNDVFKYVSDKLEHLVLDRPQSDTEYKGALKSNITEIINDLPLVLSSHNKEFYLNMVTEHLVDEIFDSESKIPRPYIQPTTKEIKDFIKDEITFFFEKCHVAISTKRQEYLETELIDLVLDLKNITDIDDEVADEVTTLLKEIGKLPEYKARYFTNLLLKDYKEFYFRERFFQLKGDVYNGRPDVYSASQGDIDQVNTKLEIYRQQILKEINKWITKVLTYDKNFIEGDCKDLASDIIDRYKYVVLHPSAKGTDAEELEHLKFLIFKWSNKLVGEENTSVLAVRELMSEINNIPKPSLQNTSEPHTLPQSIDKINNTNKCYIDMLTEHVDDWFCEVNKDLNRSEDTSQNKLLAKEFAEEIEKGLEEEGVIDKVVAEWTTKVFKDKLSIHDVEQLKNRISNVPYTKNNIAKNLKEEKVLIRAYEDIIDEWIDTIPIANKKQEGFIDNKNEIVHSLAVKIFKIQTKMKHLPVEIIHMKLQEELSHWLRKLPLLGRVDNQYDRDKYSANLVKRIKIHNINDPLGNQPKPKNDVLMVNQIENLMLEGLKKLPLYKDKSPKEKEHQEITIKGLAHKLNRTIGKVDASTDEDIIKRIRTLDPKLDDEYVKNTACQLKLYLQNLDQYSDLRKQNEKENNFLVNTIEAWLKGLPLHVSDVNQFKKQVTDFIKCMKQLISSGSDKAVMKKKILIFTRSLPISHAKKYDLRYLNGQVSKLIQSLMIFPCGDVPSQPPPKTNEMVRDAIKEWINTLPLKSVHCPVELRSFTDDMCSVLTSLILNPENNLTKQNDMTLHREIVKFLRRLPLIYELSTESHLSRMAGKLVRTLNNISLFRNENCIQSENLTVYGVSLEKTNNTDDFSIQSIQDSDINQNLATYTKQLVQQIGEWFDRLNLPTSPKEGFKEVVINDLAGDIVDRHKYLELNPNNTGTEEDELEHLKYQIFKWINKLVGEENLETIGHAEELMNRINQIPVPMLVRPQDKSQESSSQSQCQGCPRDSTDSQRSNSQSINSARRTSDTGQPAVSLRNSPNAQKAASIRISSSNDLGNPESAPCCSQDPPPDPPPPEEGTKAALFEKYVTIFREACDGLAIDESSPYAGVAKTAIYNGILKAFFNLKSNPDIENDYGYFEFILEEKLDNFLDVLPQTEELKSQRYSWKIDILKYALDLLEELHKLSDKPCFRQLVKNKFNRQFAIKYELEHCFLLQQGFLAALADAYILETNYKEKDPLKANIYKNRLMKKVDDLANHLSKEHNVGFRFFNMAQLHRLALKVLEQVPIPSDDILQDEVEEIHLADEVEKWYKGLPTQPIRNESDGVLRKRMMDLLAKKLHDMHKRLNDDDASKEDKMKHEMSQFLEKRAELQQDQDLNINFMVDELHNRLKNRWLHVHDPAEYDDFAKDKPLSSSFAHVDNADFLAPLIDGAATAGSHQAQESAGHRTLGDQEYFIQPGQPMRNINLDHTSYGAGPYGGHSLQGSALPSSSQPAAMRSMDPNLLRQAPNRTRMSHDGPSQGYVSQQGVPMQSMQAPVSPRSIHEGHITQQSPIRPNSGRLGQASMTRPQLQSMGHPSPRNGRNEREHNINQSLRQVGLVGQMRPQEQNMPSQMQGSAAPQGQLFVPSFQGRGQGQSCSPGNICSRGPTPSQGAGTTAEAAASAGAAPVSSGEDIPDGGYRVRCKCLETYRRKMRHYYEWPCDRYIG